METQWPTGCSEKPSSKAAASEEAKSYSVPYVEPLSDARTMLAGFFNNLLGIISAFGRQGDRCQTLVEAVKLFGRKSFIL
jgi:hypothetical protein